MAVLALHPSHTRSDDISPSCETVEGFGYVDGPTPFGKNLQFHTARRFTIRDPEQAVYGTDVLLQAVKAFEELEMDDDTSASSTAIAVTVQIGRLVCGVSFGGCYDCMLVDVQSMVGVVLAADGCTQWVQCLEQCIERYWPLLESSCGCKAEAESCERRLEKEPSAVTIKG